MAKFNLNQLLSDTSLNSSEQRKKLKIVMIDINKLSPSKGNFYSVENITELKDSIEMFGIKQNLLVKSLIDGNYEIISGHRRHKACRELVSEGKVEFGYVPCVIEIEKDDIKEQLLLIMSNSTTRQLTDWEKVQQTKELKKLFEVLKKRQGLSGRIRDLVAEALNVSPTHVGRIDSISNNLLPEFQEALREQQISMSTAYEVSGLSEENQKEVFEEFQEKGEMLLDDVKAKKAYLKKEVELKQIEKEENDNVVNTLGKIKKSVLRLCDCDNYESMTSKHGEFIIYRKDHKNFYISSSLTKREESIIFKYCPHCGGELEEELPITSKG